MIRFAIAVTAIEVVLTLAASLWITFSETADPYLTEQEFTMLGIPVEKYSTECRTRFGAPFSYDSQAVVKDLGPAILVSVRVGTPRAEYDNRLAGERNPKLREGDEPPTVTDEPWRQEVGYAVRQRGADGVRVEVVRLRGAEMIVLRAIRMNVPGTHAGFQVAKCERLMRILQEHLLVKLGWREAGDR